MILNIRTFHSQETTMQKVFQKTWQDTSKIYQKLIGTGVQMVPDVIWKDLEGSGGQSEALERLGGQILDTFVKSEGWGGGLGAEVTGGAYGFLEGLAPP